MRDGRETIGWSIAFTIEVKYDCEAGVEERGERGTKRDRHTVRIHHTAAEEFEPSILFAGVGIYERGGNFEIGTIAEFIEGANNMVVSHWKHAVKKDLGGGTRRGGGKKGQKTCISVTSDAEP